MLKHTFNIYQLSQPFSLFGIYGFFQINRTAMLIPPELGEKRGGSHNKLFSS